jgi:hypothetical protein
MSSNRPRIAGRRRRYRTLKKINSVEHLVERMRDGWRLVKTCRFPAVEWSCGADPVEPATAQQAIATGLIVSRHPGLFAGDDVSQSFELQ